MAAGDGLDFAAWGTAGFRDAFQLCLTTEDLSPFSVFLLVVLPLSESLVEADFRDGLADFGTCLGHLGTVSWLMIVASTFVSACVDFRDDFQLDTLLVAALSFVLAVGFLSKFCRDGFNDVLHFGNALPVSSDVSISGAIEAVTWTLFAATFVGDFREVFQLGSLLCRCWVSTAIDWLFSPSSISGTFRSFAFQLGTGDTGAELETSFFFPIESTERVFDSLSACRV